ncbi:hypothetical protein Patl1_05182 [Pistacia atlantica]|uniref:Uncharacterized protein n=1 Tax=Pistacia atlantica TaxID=434234 RepID=A0ACC1BUX6_9ROSI|nr:hypothetical protein Patl1_05182 [Pistacia atlantica]
MDSKLALRSMFASEEWANMEVLRLVDGDAKPAIGYIYEAMRRAKNQIAKNFNNVEHRYREIWKIIDTRWDFQLHRPLHAVAYYLNLKPASTFVDRNLDTNEVDASELVKCCCTFCGRVEGWLCVQALPHAGCIVCGSSVPWCGAFAAPVNIYTQTVPITHL